MKWIFALFVVGMFLLAGCPQQQQPAVENDTTLVQQPPAQPVVQPEPQKIKVGFIGPLSGANSQEGNEALDSLKIAAKDFSTDDYTYEIVEQDGGCDGATAANALDALSSQGIEVIIGGVCPQEADGMAPLLEQKGMILIALSNGNVNNDYVMDFAGSPEAFGNQTAEFFLSKGWRRTMIVTDGSPSAMEEKGLIEAAAKANAMPSLPAESYDPNFAATALKIKGEVPQVVLVFSSDSAKSAAIVNALRATGVSAPILGDKQIVSADAVSAMGPNAEGIYAIMPEFDENDPMAAFYLNSYTSLYGAPNDKALVVDSRNALAIFAQAESFLSYESTLEQMRQYWLNLDSWAGAGASMNFHNGDRVASFRFVKISGGSAVPA